jgi:hypothetical protein
MHSLVNKILGTYLNLYKFIVIYSNFMDGLF